MLRHYFNNMDKTYYKFKQIMALVEEFPNDQELGSKVREVYWTQKQTKADPNQLTIPFPKDPIEILDEDDYGRQD